MTRPRAFGFALMAVLTFGTLVYACNTGHLTHPSERGSFAATAVNDSVYLIGAGDVAGCPETYKDEATAALIRAELERHPQARVFAAGDLAYNNGTAAEWLCYADSLSWGAFKSQTWPALGNHDNNTELGRAYYRYFNDGADSGRVGKWGRGWYAVQHGPWRLLFLNTEYRKALPEGSTLNPQLEGMKEQGAWIRAEMDAHPSHCTAMITHKVAWSSVGDPMVPAGFTKPLYWAFYTKGGDLALGAHHHQYERTAQITDAGALDPVNGFRQFVAGGGGSPFLSDFLATPKPYSQKRLKLHGVLFLALASDGYRWEYRGLDGTVLDAGTGSCVGPDPTPEPEPDPEPTDDELIRAMLDSTPVTLGVFGDSISVWLGDSADVTTEPDASGATAQEALVEAASL